MKHRIIHKNFTVLFMVILVLKIDEKMEYRIYDEFDEYGLFIS